MSDSTVSIIITILNGEKWIDRCFKSIFSQNRRIHVFSRLSNGHQKYYDETSPPEEQILKLEVCVFNDCSTDKTHGLLIKWKNIFHLGNINMKVIENRFPCSKGVGYGRNAAIEQSSGSYLCFQDIDDEMLPGRIVEQYKVSRLNKDAIVGSKFIRSPQNSTYRFSQWANEIEEDQLEVQIYTSHGPTIVMPTWFCHKSVFERIGGFSEDGRGTPEDLLFFYKHLDLGGRILRVNKTLIVYQYHMDATTFTVLEETIWKIRLNRIIRYVLNHAPWKNGFTIWNAGKQGRRFFRDIPDWLKISVRAFCDVDKKKINKFYRYYDKNKRKITYSIPIIHFTLVKPPIVICMKLGLTNGAFEENLQSLNLVEGKDFLIFS